MSKHFKTFNKVHSLSHGSKEELCYISFLLLLRHFAKKVGDDFPDFGRGWKLLLCEEVGPSRNLGALWTSSDV